jgi:hypothetical protein
MLAFMAAPFLPKVQALTQCIRVNGEATEVTVPDSCLTTTSPDLEDITQVTHICLTTASPPDLEVTTQVTRLPHYSLTTSPEGYHPGNTSASLQPHQTSRIPPK